MDDQLNGISRNIKSDFQMDKMGFFTNGRLNGYGRLDVLGSTKEGIMKNNEMVLDYSFCKE